MRCSRAAGRCSTSWGPVAPCRRGSPRTPWWRETVRSATRRPRRHSASCRSERGPSGALRRQRHAAALFLRRVCTPRHAHSYGTPTRSPLPVPRRAGTPPRSPRRMSKTVLLAEDHEDNRLALQLMLEHAGYRTLGAKDGREAVELARQHVPDLIMMDLSMPVLDG